MDTNAQDEPGTKELQTPLQTFGFISNHSITWQGCSHCTVTEVGAAAAKGASARRASKALPQQSCLSQPSPAGAEWYRGFRRGGCRRIKSEMNNVQSGFKCALETNCVIRSCFVPCVPVTGASHPKLAHSNSTEMPEGRRLGRGQRIHIRGHSYIGWATLRMATLAAFPLPFFAK